MKKQYQKPQMASFELEPMGILMVSLPIVDDPLGGFGGG